MQENRIIFKFNSWLSFWRLRRFTRIKRLSHAPVTIHDITPVMGVTERVRKRSESASRAQASNRHSSDHDIRSSSNSSSSSSSCVVAVVTT